MALTLPLVLLLLLSGPTGVSVQDTPSDNGESIDVSWEMPEGVAGLVDIVVQRAGPDEEFQEIARVATDMNTYLDETAQDKIPYRYRIGYSYPDTVVFSAETEQVISTPQWFNTNYFNVAIGLAIFAVLVLIFIQQARSGRELFVRRIAGLEAVDEAVGRATEMGRAILYVPGTGYIEDIGTIASMNLLGEVAKKAAEYGVELKVPNREPVVYTVTKEIVKGAYMEVGRPDQFDPDSVFFLTRNVLAYASAVDGIMMREKPATNFLMGPFAAESLILAETGAAVGAIQIAGCDKVTQLPFFIVACDYTLIGEELYAASSYLSREPLMLGALKGQDYGKAILTIFLILATAMSLIFNVDISGWFN